MAVKRDVREPLFYALIFAVLFWYRYESSEATLSRDTGCW
jgi:DMSO/TMAO reductase YedYZ heme-binding membrane subunit